MKNSGICAKCEHNDVLRIEQPVTVEGSGAIQVGITTFSAVKVIRYVCTKCGFVESWVDDQEGIDKLIKKYC
jgi:predicted nucleic-acid-binding Zn-ribbon protein